MLTLRLPPEIDERLSDLCKKTRRPKSFYVKEALLAYLGDMEDIYISLDRITQKNRVSYTSSEVLAELKQQKD